MGTADKAGVSKSSKNVGGEGKLNLGVDPEGSSRVSIARGKTPEENMKVVFHRFGGIEKIVSSDNIVILKPNAQWWNQGMTNTNALKVFMEEVLSIPGFRGEIIIYDNHQFEEADGRGWTTEDRNTITISSRCISRQWDSET